MQEGGANSSGGHGSGKKFHVQEGEDVECKDGVVGYGQQFINHETVREERWQCSGTSTENSLIIVIGSRWLGFALVIASVGLMMTISP